jgi:hypothetical protein
MGDSRNVVTHFSIGGNVGRKSTVFDIVPERTKNNDAVSSSGDMNPIETVVATVSSFLRGVLGFPMRTVVADSINDWFHNPDAVIGKSIARGYTFKVTMIPNLMLLDRVFSGHITAPPLIKSWHVKDINIPHYDFKKETVFAGKIPRSYGVADKQGLPDVEITFEEDNAGSIEYFANWLRKTIINAKGLHNPPVMQKLFHFVVIHYDVDGYPMNMYAIKDCFYSGSGGTKLSYTADGAVDKTIKFGCDNIGYMNLSYLAQSLLGGKANAIIYATNAVASMFS